MRELWNAVGRAGEAGHPRVAVSRADRAAAGLHRRRRSVRWRPADNRRAGRVRAAPLVGVPAPQPDRAAAEAPRSSSGRTRWSSTCRTTCAVAAERLHRPTSGSHSRTGTKIVAAAPRASAICAVARRRDSPGGVRSGGASRTHGSRSLKLGGADDRRDAASHGGHARARGRLHDRRPWDRADPESGPLRIDQSRLHRLVHAQPGAGGVLHRPARVSRASCSWASPPA